MNNIYMAYQWVKEYQEDYYAYGGLPEEGVLYGIKEKSLFVHYNEGFKSISIPQKSRRGICIFSDDDVLLGKLDSRIKKNKKSSYLYVYEENVGVTVEDGSKGSNYLFFNKDGSSFEWQGDFYCYGWNEDIFYGNDCSASSIIGVKNAEVIWQVLYEKSYRYPHPFLLENNFYLFSGGQLSSYSYDGGVLNYSVPLESVPGTVYELNNVAAIQSAEKVMVVDVQGIVLGEKSLPQDYEFGNDGCYLLGMDANYLYVSERKKEEQCVVIYDYSMTEQHRVVVPVSYNLIFQNVSDELNALSLQMTRERIVGSSIMSFWHPDETLTIEGFLPELEPFKVERITENNASSYQIYIDADNKDDLFRLCDVIVNDVANKYGEDYCDNPDLDSEFSGKIQVLVDPILFQSESEWIKTIQNRLNEMIARFGGNLNNGVIAGNKKGPIEVTLISKI